MIHKLSTYLDENNGMSNPRIHISLEKYQKHDQAVFLNVYYPNKCCKQNTTFDSICNKGWNILDPMCQWPPWIKWTRKIFFWYKIIWIRILFLLSMHWKPWSRWSHKRFNSHLLITYLRNNSINASYWSHQLIQLWLHIYF